MCPAPTKAASAHRGASRIHRLTDSANHGDLVAVIGTGVSVGLTGNTVPALSWKGLIRDGFAYGVRKGTISEAQSLSWKAQLDSVDLDDLLGAAEFVGRKLDAPEGDLYARWLESVFKTVEPTNAEMIRAIQALHAAGIPISTLNYDGLIERVTGLQPINLTEKPKVAGWMRRETPGILHLHGTWDVPPSCILGIRDYQATLASDVRDLIQRSLWSFRRLMFIGCGDTFADPNFSALLKWLKDNLGAAAPEHYALVTDAEVAVRNADPSWRGFVEPLGYGSGHGHLPRFLLKHFPSIKSLPKREPHGTSRASSAASHHGRLLRDYRSFLLRDCGEMTIEGMRADMDTAQRRFDLERLFVPITVLPSPPDIPTSDLAREQKLLRWREKNSEPRSFGTVFSKHKRLALLALPGGGKTLLLKRLAVAYADSARRKASVDALPDVDLTPVLIRCREWREHIHRPILTLLKNIPEITGQAPLEGLAAALVPLFKQGRILLLVDGLDEIHDDALRSTFVEHLESFLRDNKLTRLVVTSREAGFSLVAPSLARFCERWKMAPLAPDAVTALCSHWHSLMTGDSLEAQQEAQDVAHLLLRNESLRRLAENPLLLTMLLVVKHGAGRLPPDRVSLYSRAVEVLLDTWNIKGHDPLSLKEAVPQLACVAFELMRAGKQTATESELLGLLDEARGRVPQIRRYAKDAPHEFLKRVELRSSLVVEAGRQMEGSSTVPFYQFRHLTFQEYLAAVAAAEGHYMDYDKGDTVLSPLENYVTAEEWKEVIPMAAVLARKQAEPLIGALVSRATKLRQQVEAGNYRLVEEENELGLQRLPGSVSRLVQCLVEEAEAAPETLSAALEVIAFFAKGCWSGDDWPALCRGPYGEELLHQAWLLYASSRIGPDNMWFRTTCARVAALRRSDGYWDGSEGHSEMTRLLISNDVEEIGRGLLTWCGILLGSAASGKSVRTQMAPPLSTIERHIFRDERELSEAAIWAFVLLGKNRDAPPTTPAAVLDRFLAIWLRDHELDPDGIGAYGLSSQAGMPRDSWMPVLTEQQLQQVREAASTKGTAQSEYNLMACYVVAFHAKNVWPDDEFAARLIEDPTLRQEFRWAQKDRPSPVDYMLEAMGRERDKSVRRSGSRLGK
jgi:SIR2-like domain/NACHT domain